MSARDPLQELEDALSFPVSPDFSARVRQQVAAEPVRSRIFGGWRLAAAAAVVLAAGIAAITTLRTRDADVGKAAGPRLVEAATPVQRGPETVAAVERVRVPHRAAVVAAREIVTAFETVVPDDQLRALDQLLAAMRAGRATVPPDVADAELNERGERVLRPLVIEPVIVNPIKDPNK